MLTDQTFKPVDLFGVGPELFFAPNPMGVDLNVVNRVRAMCLTMPFRLVWYSLVNSPNFGRTCELLATLHRLGIVTDHVFFFEEWRDSALGDTTSLVSALNICGLVYSPEFTAKLRVSNRLTLNNANRPAQVLAGMEQVCRSSAPYSPDTLRRLIIES